MLMQLIFYILNYLPFNLKMQLQLLSLKKCYELGYEKPNWVKKMNFSVPKNIFWVIKINFSVWKKIILGDEKYFRVEKKIFRW